MEYMKASTKKAEKKNKCPPYTKEADAASGPASLLSVYICMHYFSQISKAIKLPYLTGEG
ncbi:MAG: hypothetical protein GX757_11805 [Clostridiales bacterium]|nr:hypothetical protein [Clostridiales bacterium]